MGLNGRFTPALRYELPVPWKAAGRVRQPTFLGQKVSRNQRGSGAGAALDGAVGTVRIDVERTGGSIDHFARDHDLFDAFQTRKVEHGLEQDAFEDRTQAPRAGLALDRLAGDRAKRL